jgi:hypothetical protein
MSSPYRDTLSTEDTEPLPDFGNDQRLWPGLVRHSIFVSVVALALALYDVAEAVKFLVLCGPGVVVGAILALLQRPVGAWLEERHARLVAEGVAELEAKVSAAE